MTRLSVPVLLLAVGIANGQDMPLHEILKPGETWQPQPDGMPAHAPGPKQIDLRGRPLRVYDRVNDGTPDGLRREFKEPVVGILTPDGSTFYVADATDRYVWALRRERTGNVYVGDRYVRLRVRGDERRKKATPPEDYGADPSAMTMDRSNRLYAATNLGIQVFDPTGRLCGVFTAPPGRVTELAFDGDRLFARAGDRVFVRRMLAEGNPSPK